MALPTNSFEKFNYGLRPCKQIERRIMIEVLLRLGKADYDIPEYTYIGFGSPYYIDFVMFHKFLFIQEMICLEWSDVPQRMKFNKPFTFIKLKMMPFRDYIPKMRNDTKYLAWLDYDRPLDQEMLADLKCLKRMAQGSIFIITIDARAKLPADLFNTSQMGQTERNRFTLEVYQQWFGNYLDDQITLNDLTPNGVPELFYKVAREVIRRILRPDGLSFHQLFNILYADGALMLTIGGVIGTAIDGERLLEKGCLAHEYVRGDRDFLNIRVPHLTTREKNWLDARLKAQMRADEIAFEIEQELLTSYCTFYKEYPTYMEVFV